MDPPPKRVRRATAKAAAASASAAPMGVGSSSLPQQQSQTQRGRGRGSQGASCKVVSNEPNSGVRSHRSPGNTIRRRGGRTFRRASGAGRRGSASQYSKDPVYAYLMRRINEEALLADSTSPEAQAVSALFIKFKILLGISLTDCS